MGLLLRGQQLSDDFDDCHISKPKGKRTSRTSPELLRPTLDLRRACGVRARSRRVLLAITLFGREHGGNRVCGLQVQVLDQRCTLILAQRRIAQDGNQLPPFSEKDRADFLFLPVTQMNLRVQTLQVRVGEKVGIAHDVVRRGSGLRSGLGDGKTNHERYENDKFPHKASRMRWGVEPAVATPF